MKPKLRSIETRKGLDGGRGHSDTKFDGAEDYLCGGVAYWGQARERVFAELKGRDRVVGGALGVRGSEVRLEKSRKNLGNSGRPRDQGGDTGFRGPRARDS